MRKIIFTLLVLLASTTFLSAQKVFNKNYVFGSDIKSVAFVPIISNDFQKNDEIANIILTDTLNLNYFDVASLRSKLDAKSIEILKRIAEKSYKKKELKEFPNLNTIVSPDEIKYIKQTFDNADLLLFPIVFNVSQGSGMTFGTSKFRLYDLNTGDLIQQFSESLNVGASGEEGLAVMTTLLIVDVKSDLLENLKQ